MTKDEFVFSIGHFGRGDPVKVVRALRKLKKNGRLTPEAVLKAARNPKSPLHLCFEWDDTIAAEKYRQHQARNLVNHVRVQVLNEETGELSKPQRVFVHDVDDEGPHYREIVDVEEAVTTDRIMAQAISDLVDWVNRYEDLADQLPGVFYEVHKVIRAEKKSRVA